MKQKLRCSAQTAAGNPCRSYAVEGSDRCSSHLGLASRPTLLTDELGDNLVAMLRAGAYLPVALRALGVARRTFQDWMARGRSGRVEDERYARFRELVEQAQGRAEVTLVAEIATASRSNWQAAAWLLERLAPSRYGKPSVRLRDEAPPSEPVEPPADDPFREVDELAARRRAVGSD